MIIEVQEYIKITAYTEAARVVYHWHFSAGMGGKSDYAGRATTPEAAAKEALKKNNRLIMQEMLSARLEDKDFNKIFLFLPLSGAFTKKNQKRP